MFCKYCGQELQENAVFCQNCGAKLDDAQDQTTQETNQTAFDETASTEQFASQTDYSQQVGQTYTPAYPMKWFQFLIYFLLFASAVLNVLSGIEQFTGKIYETTPGDGMIELVYSTFPALKPIDIIVGILMVALGAFAIVVRFALAKYKAVGPKLLLLLYASACVLNVIYCLAAVIVVPDLFSILAPDIVTNVVTSVIMIVINNNYFKNRKELFIN